MSSDSNWDHIAMREAVANGSPIWLSYMPYRRNGSWQVHYDEKNIRNVIRSALRAYRNPDSYEHKRTFEVWRLYGSARLLVVSADGATYKIHDVEGLPAGVDD